MSLRYRFFISLAAVFAVLLVGSLAISLYNARNNLLAQMTAHAQGTAVTLGLTLSGDLQARTTSHHSVAPDTATAALASIIDMVFEKERYRSIVYRDVSNTVVIARTQDETELAAPAWFTEWMQLGNVSGSAAVMAGDTLMGTVKVIINPDNAYTDLWATFREQVLLYGLVSGLTFLFASFGVNMLLRPLKRVEEQAAAICERHFVQQTEMPRSRELRQVVEAMNRMSRKLKDIFHEQLALTESLRAQSHLDPVTALSNRREFNARLQSVADNEMGNGGCLMIIQVSEFGHYNLKYGHEAGDECLRAIAGILQQCSRDVPDALVSRRAGADFAIYLPRISSDRTELLADQLMARLTDLDILHGHAVHVGTACCDILRADHRLLAEADLALRQAQSRTNSGWQMYENENISQIARDARHWYNTLNHVLQERELTFHYQPLFSVDDEHAVAVEIYARITMQEKLVNAGIFMPMAERFGLAESFDRLIIDQVRLGSEAIRCQHTLSINLSPQTINSTDFLAWLTGYLNEHPAFARQLIIETSEYLVRIGPEQTRMLCTMLHRHGAKLSLDHFGIHSAAFGYLHSLPLDYVKIDRSFIRDIHLNPDNQFYVRSLIQIAHSCDVTIFAEGVENEQEWQCLQSLGIDGGQGYYLAKPGEAISNRRD